MSEIVASSLIDENLGLFCLSELKSSGAINCITPSTEPFENNIPIVRRHSSDVGFVYDGSTDDNCNLNTIIENNNKQLWANRRHSLHSMDYLRKLNDLEKQLKNGNKNNKLDLSKRIFINKSNSSSI